MPDQYSVEPFKDDDGTEPVIQYINGLFIKERVVLYDAIQKLRELGPYALELKAFKRFNDHLFEITKGDNRIIYLREGNHFELLHGFPKNSQKTFRKDKQIAEDRYKTYWRRK